MQRTAEWIARLCGVVLLIAALAKTGSGDWLMQWLVPGAESDAASIGLGWIVVVTESVLGAALAVSPNRFAAAGAVSFGTLACSYAVLRHLTSAPACPCLGALGEAMPQAAKGLPALVAGVGFVTTGSLYVFRANPGGNPLNEGEHSCEPAH